MPMCHNNSVPAWVPALPFVGPCPGGWTEVQQATSTNPNQGASPSNPNPGLPAGQSALTQTPQAISNAANSAVGQAVGNVIPDTLKDPTTWKRLGLIGVGVLCIVFGGALLLFGPGGQVSTQTGKVLA